MKVWIVNPFDNLPQEGNRPQRYYLMAQAFARAGHSVTLWTSDFSHATKAKRRIDSAIPLEPGVELLQIATLPYPRNVSVRRILSHRRLARDFFRLAMAKAKSERPEVIVASTPPLGLCAAALQVARRCGAKFVADIQDAWPETFERLLPRGGKWLKGLVFSPMARTASRIYRQADLVTGVSRRYARLAKRPDFYLAYHGIEAAEGAAESRRWDSPPTRLVYAGNLGSGYDLATVLRAMTKRLELTLDIAGLGPKLDSLKAQVAQLELDGRVRFHGYLGEAELRRLLLASEVGLIPMRDDSWVGLPYKLGDYLKAGLRVLSSLRGECGEFLERTQFGRVYAWGDADSFLSALAGLKSTAVALPLELKSGHIYPEYVRRIEGICYTA